MKHQKKKKKRFYIACNWINQKKTLDANNAKEYNQPFFKNKNKNCLNDQNNYSTAQTYKKPKHYCHKVSYYKTFKTCS